MRFSCSNSALVMRNCLFTKNNYISLYFMGIILGGFAQSFLPVNSFYVQTSTIHGITVSELMI